jgi:hypothetical protein
MTKAELKTKYHKMTYAELVSEIKAAIGSLRDAQEKSIEILYYMKIFNRWNDEPMYKRTTWATWLMSEFNMREQTFRDNLLAWQHYPDVSRRYTPGLVPSIVRKCGSDNVPRVIKQLAAVEAAQKHPLKYEQIEAVIDKNRKPTLLPKRRIDVRDLQDKATQTEDRLREVTKAVVSKDEQISKLKATVRMLQAEKQGLIEENDALRKRVAELLATLIPMGNLAQQDQERNQSLSA